MKKFFVIIALLLTSIIATTTTIHAQDMTLQNYLDEMGTYASTQTVMERVKVYINEGMVDFIESTGTTVYSSETKHYFLGIYIYSSFKYYYYVDKYVEEIITERTLYNDIDSLIFILNELDNFAHAYNGCANDELNCVLGYVRSINVNYSNTSELYGGNWNVMAGDVDEGFIDYVDDNDGTALEISEYFSAFVPTSSQDTLYDKALYNEDLFGDAYSQYEFLIGSGYDNNGLKQYKLLDPFNYQSYIDLIHLFASMDGIYENTGKSLELGNNHQRDILSWGGDLQQMAYTIRNVDVASLPEYIDYGSGYANVSVDFCDLVNFDSCGLSEDDLLADIDAMNMVITFLDNDVNDRVSLAFSAYYNVIGGDDSYKPNRYKMFLETITDTIELSNNGNTTTEKFKQEVYITLDVLPNGDSYKNYDFTGYTYVGYGLLRGSFVPFAGTLPNVNLRGYLADTFIEYILDMSTRPVYYGS